MMSERWVIWWRFWGPRHW